MAKSKGMSGVAIAMIGTGALAIYSAIQGVSPLETLRSILKGERPSPLGTQPRGTPIAAGGAMETATYQGPGGKGGKARTVGARPHVAAEAQFIAATWNIVADATLVSTGHIPNSDHYRGLAIDAMVPAGVQGTNIGDAIFTHYRLNAAQKRVKYIIWRHTIWSPGKGARRYAKSDHMRHVHISFYDIGSSRAQ
jgi:hypothetical protein